MLGGVRAEGDDDSDSDAEGDDSANEAAGNGRSDGEDSEEEELFKVRKTIAQEDRAAEDDSSRGDFAAAVIHNWDDAEVGSLLLFSFGSVFRFDV